MEKNKLAHFPALDGLRGLAILTVICHNGLILEQADLTRAEKLLQYVLNQGWVGVLLFFVLSGFLITGILLDSVGKPHAMRDFVVRRALRIFPLYYGFLLVVFVLLPWLDMQPAIYEAHAPHQIWLWLYLDNWANALAHQNDALPHFWSLSVEEQFYLFWPLLVLSLRTPQRVAKACLAVAAVGVACRIGSLMAGFDASDVYEMTTSRLDALALGGFAAACWRVPAWADWVRRHAGRLSIAMLGIFLGGAVLTHGFPRLSSMGVVVGYLVLAVVFAHIIYQSAWRDAHAGTEKQPWQQRALTWTPLQQIGKYSYGMYVFHKPLHDLVGPHIQTWMGIGTPHTGSALGYLVVLTGLTYAAAWLSFTLYEVHFLRLKRYFT